MAINHLVVGLGNPGQEYARSRHNAGFMFVDYLVDTLGLSADNFKSKSRWQAEIMEFQEILFVKPQTFMNRSGQAVQAIRQFYRLDHEAIIVAFDDLDLELGACKLQLGRGPKIHNGLDSIYDQLGTQDFWHVRIGVDSRGGDRTIPAHQYVLQTMTTKEQTALKESFQAAAKLLSKQGLLSVPDHD